jgi:DNA polymerase kappa
MKKVTHIRFYIGIACNRTLAKICSDIDKPNGQYYLPINKALVLAFVQKLRVRQLPGVGRVTERVLESLGVKTCNDIYQHRAVLYKLLSPISFQFLLRNYLGLGNTSFSADVERKSIGVERTFSAMSDPGELFNKLKELAILLEADLEKAGFMGRNVGIKLKSVTYEMRIRSKTFPSYIWMAKDIERIAKDLLMKELPINIRLMGLRISTMKPRGSEDESVMKVFRYNNRYRLKSFV